MPDFDGLQPFLFAHITAIWPLLSLVTALIRAVYVPFTCRFTYFGSLTITPFPLKPPKAGQRPAKQGTTLAATKPRRF